MLPEADFLQFIPLGNLRYSLALSTMMRSLSPFRAWGSWDGPVPFHHPDHTFSGMSVSENTTLTVAWFKAVVTSAEQRLSKQSIEDLRGKVLQNI